MCLELKYCVSICSSILCMQELELNIRRLVAEKTDIHNESVHVSEQSEQRQQKIRQLEVVRCFSSYFICYFSVFQLILLVAKCHMKLLSGRSGSR